MSTVSHGLDPQQVREVAGQVTATADELTQTREQGDAQLALLRDAWAGDDLEIFDAEWSGQSIALDQTADALRAAAKELERQAADQEQASGGEGSAPRNVSQAGGQKDDKPWYEDVWDSVVDAGKAILDAGEEVIDTVVEGATWVFGKVTEGLAWVGGKISDGAAWLADKVGAALEWVGDRASSILLDWADAMGDLGAAAGNLFKLLGGFAFGDVPALSELVSSAIMLTGAALNFALLGQTHFFEAGNGHAGEVTELGDDPVSNAAGDHPPLRTPESLSDIMLNTTDAYEVRGPDGSGNVRITEVTQADGTTSYIVNVPGTEDWSPAGSANPLDATGNFDAMSGEQSAAMEAVAEAMAEAGIPPDAPVMLVAHSQGGIVTASLLSDPAFTDSYNITHSVTYGSPVGTFDVPPGVDILNLAHGNDIVPQLDIGPMAVPPGNVTNVVLDSPGRLFDFSDNHSHQNYADSVAASDDPALQEYIDGLDDFIVTEGDGSTVTGQDVEIGQTYDR